MNKEARKRLLDALNACHAIRQFTAGKTLGDYQGNLLLRSGVERQFEIVGEALRQADMADPDVQNSISDLHVVVGMRNRIIHAYSVVDNKLVWDTAQNDLPRLVEQLNTALR